MLRTCLNDLSIGLNHAELLARLRSVLKFAKNGLVKIEAFSPHWDKDPDGLVSQTDKTIVETALLALIASRVRNSSVLPDLVELARLLSPLARNERNQVLLLRFPHTAASIGISHIALTRMGYPDMKFDALVRTAFASGHVDATERLPYRSMDLSWLRGLLDPDKRPNFRDLLPYSILNTTAHPVYMAETDVYAVTHALMYLTDFGNDPLPAGVERERLSSLIDACLAWHILSGNLDLIGELLMCSAILGGPWSPYAKLGFEVLTNVWDELGFLPSSAFNSETYRGLAGDAASAYAYRHIYHSTYVGGILCQLLLRYPEHFGTATWSIPDYSSNPLLDRCGQTLRTAHAFCGPDSEDLIHDDPEPLVDPLDTLRRTSNKLRTYPGAAGKPGAPWTEALTMSSLRTEELALVLNDGLLILAARDYRLSTLAAALLDRTSSVLPATTTVLEATAFLTRQQLPSGAIGAHFVVPENVQARAAINVTATLANCIANAALYIRSQHIRQPSEPLEASL